MLLLISRTAFVFVLLTTVMGRKDNVVNENGGSDDNVRTLHQDNGDKD